MITACELCKMLPDPKMEIRVKDFCELVIDKALREAKSKTITLPHFFYKENGKMVYGYTEYEGSRNQAYCPKAWGKKWSSDNDYQYVSTYWAYPLDDTMALDTDMIREILAQHGFSMKLIPQGQTHIWSYSCSGKSKYFDTYLSTFKMEISIDCPNVK